MCVCACVRDRVCVYVCALPFLIYRGRRETRASLETLGTRESLESLANQSVHTNTHTHINSLSLSLSLPLSLSLSLSLSLARSLHSRQLSTLVVLK